MKSPFKAEKLTAKRAKGQAGAGVVENAEESRGHGHGDEPGGHEGGEQAEPSALDRVGRRPGAGAGIHGGCEGRGYLRRVPSYVAQVEDREQREPRLLGGEEGEPQDEDRSGGHGLHLTARR